MTNIGSPTPLDRLMSQTVLKMEDNQNGGRNPKLGISEGKIYIKEGSESILSKIKSFLYGESRKVSEQLKTLFTEQFGSAASAKLFENINQKKISFSEIKDMYQTAMNNVKPFEKNLTTSMNLKTIFEDVINYSNETKTMRNGGSQSHLGRSDYTQGIRNKYSDEKHGPAANLMESYTDFTIKYQEFSDRLLSNNGDLKHDMKAINSNFESAFMKNAYPNVVGNKRDFQDSAILGVQSLMKFPLLVKDLQNALDENNGERIKGFSNEILKVTSEHSRNMLELSEAIKNGLASETSKETREILMAMSDKLKDMATVMSDPKGPFGKLSEIAIEALKYPATAGDKLRGNHV